MFDSWYKCANREADEARFQEVNRRLVVEGLALNIFTRIGTWIERHFPEKMNAADVSAQVQAFEHNLDTMQAQANHSDERISDLIRDVAKIQIELAKMIPDLEKLNMQNLIQSRKVGTVPSAMTPFAHRLYPVKPAANTNGGTRSAQ